MQTLITTRLILRGWTPDDAGDLFEIGGNPNVAAGAGWKPLGNRDEALGLIDGFNERSDVWAIEHRLKNKVIGTAGLKPDVFRHDDVNCKMLTFSVAETYWGCGYAREAACALLKHAFIHLKLDFVAVHHFPSNDRSKRVIEKCGFASEGTLRRAVRLWDGQIQDAVCYSILREEFLSAYRPVRGAGEE